MISTNKFIVSKLRLLFYVSVFLVVRNSLTFPEYFESLTELTTMKLVNYVHVYTQHFLVTMDTATLPKYVRLLFRFGCTTHGFATL